MDAMQKGRRMSFLAVEPLTVTERVSSSDCASPASLRRTSLQHQSSIVRITPVKQGMMYGLKQLMYRACTVLLAGIIGAASYVVLLVVLVLALL
jgi:hypothetical protein